MKLQPQRHRRRGDCDLLGETIAGGDGSESSYLSVNDRRLHFGLGAAASADVEIHWPSGVRESVKSAPGDRLITIREGEGIVKTQAFSGTPRGR